MPKCWSINTTMRNPERVYEVLEVLKEFEGQVFDEKTQALFFKRCIQKKRYMPENLPFHIQKMFDDPDEFTDEELNNILNNYVYYNNKQYKNDQEKIYALRARTTLGVINRMGLAIAKKSYGKVKISQAGYDVLNGNADYTKVFLRFFLKWQLPNPSESGYSKFNIIPFIATLHVIKKVNNKWSALGNEPVGLSKEEFSLFIPTLTHYTQIDNTVEKIIEFRSNVREMRKNNNQNAGDFIFQTAKNIVVQLYNLSDDKEIIKKINNLYDYGDSAIRYFRITGLLRYRGNQRYVDFAPTRLVEIDKIIDTFDGSIRNFKTEEEYLEYLIDINQPELEWENIEDQKKIYHNLMQMALELQNEIENKYGSSQAIHVYNLKYETFNNVTQYITANNKLRDIIKTLNYDLSILRERDLKNLTEYINKLEYISNKKNNRKNDNLPLDLEWYTALTLMSLDDALEIKPNLIVGDDNLPVFTAQGNKPDIECYYQSFNMICEVTLQQSKLQWVSESIPVMRHLRDIEDKNPNKDNYCLFIAPSIHGDTLNYFFYSNKYGYEGKKQKIIPLTLQQYIKLLKKLRNRKEKDINYHITHQQIKDILYQLYIPSIIEDDSIKWKSKIELFIEEFQ